MACPHACLKVALGTDTFEMRPSPSYSGFQNICTAILNPRGKIALWLRTLHYRSG